MPQVKGAFAIAKAGFFFGRVFLYIKKKVQGRGFPPVFTGKTYWQKIHFWFR